AQSMLIPHHFSREWRLAPYGKGFVFTCKDAFYRSHRTFWPRWYLEDLVPFYSKQLSTTNKKMTQLHANSLPNNNLSLIFAESSPRRLVYLLSTTYLLSKALQIAIDRGLPYCIAREKIPLCSLYNLCSTDAGRALLKRLIRFLSMHQVFNYDEEHETVA